MNKFIFIGSAAALLAGFILDRLFGDPYRFPHMVRGMGKWIALLEKILRRVLPASPSGEITGGVFLVSLTVLLSAGVPFALLSFFYALSPALGFVLESFLTYQLLAAKSLKVESMKVCDSLLAGDVEAARRHVSMIVGRDTSVLDREGIARAAVETVAENTSDGVAASVFYLMLGGPVLGCAYKAVNTMDSMVGYKNEKYLYFGRAAAKLDDFLNYIPSRLCAALMILCAYVLSPFGFDGKNALRIWRRDRRKHASPNSAQTESVCAGALGVRLAGPAVYFGKKVEKPFIGDDTRPVEPEDIKRANRLMYASSLAATVCALIFRAAWGWVLYG
ncbi:MAG: adenosylcobinamide-phosphate synthase CbiB [Clostridiales bacterium]|nr:adenosylcobinamide-phosphate synthase CbiB [Clostridiales bacterium]